MKVTELRDNCGPRRSRPSKLRSHSRAQRGGRGVRCEWTDSRALVFILAVGLYRFAPDGILPHCTGAPEGGGGALAFHPGKRLSISITVTYCCSPTARWTRSVPRPFRPGDRNHPRRLVLRFESRWLYRWSADGRSLRSCQLSRVVRKVLIPDYRRTST